MPRSVQVVGVLAEHPGHLLGHDFRDEDGELVLVGGALDDRPTIEDQSTWHAALRGEEPAQGHAVLPGGGVGGWDLLDRQLEAEALTQPVLDPLGGIEDQVVEAVAAAGHRRHGGPGKRAAEAASPPVPARAHGWTLDDGRLARGRGGTRGSTVARPTVCAVTLTRQCSKTACVRPATSTLTYVYAEQTAVLGPLAIHAEPHSYDLCEEHATRLTAPRGWDVVRLELPDGQPRPPVDDLAALADAVREHRGTMVRVESTGTEPEGATVTEIARRGHLRVLRDR